MFVGLLIGEGSFGGDGKQPQITLRMHVRHEALFRWLMDRFPRTRLYGPYHHGGRSYYQWMARGRALVQRRPPVLLEEPRPELDAHAAERLRSMRKRYAAYIERERALRVGAVMRSPGRAIHADSSASPSRYDLQPAAQATSAGFSDCSSATTGSDGDREPAGGPR